MAPRVQHRPRQRQAAFHAALGGRRRPIAAFYDAQGQLLHVDVGALPEPALRQHVHDLYNVGT